MIKRISRFGGCDLCELQPVGRYTPCCDKCGVYDICEVQLRLKELLHGPQTDKVIRCIECKHWHNGWCYKNGRAFEFNDFCSQGELKDERTCEDCLYKDSWDEWEGACDDCTDGDQHVPIEGKGEDNG